MIINGDCLEELKKLDENSVDAVVTDPPYGLEFMGKEWDAPWKGKASKEFNTSMAGKLGGFKKLPNHSRVNNIKCKKCDKWKFSGNPCKCEKPDFEEARLQAVKGFQDFCYQWATECLRVLKPGGHLLSFGGSRTYHRMACAIEDAGFEVRDMIEWVYGVGFPKSLNVFKQLKKNCTCGNMEAYEKAEQNTEYGVRPMPETDLSEAKSIKEEQGEVLQSGLSEQGLHRTVQGEKSQKSSVRGKERSVEGRSNLQKSKRELQRGEVCEVSKEVSTDGEKGRIHNGTQANNGSALGKDIKTNGSGTSHRPQPEQQQDREPCAFCKQWGTQATRTYGLGTALKPAHEPVCMARKPLSEKTVAENCLKWGTGGINIDESRVNITDTKNGFRPNSANKQYKPTDSFAGGRITEQHPNGRFPANLIHDNSEEVRECFPETKGALAPVKSGQKGFGGVIYGKYKQGGDDGATFYGDQSGNASRFFKSIIYQAKASKKDRNEGLDGFEEKHKGTDLMVRTLWTDSERKHLSELLSKKITDSNSVCADKYGFSPTLISFWKKGERIPTPETYEKLRVEYGLGDELDYIIYEHPKELTERTTILDNPAQQKSKNNHPTVKPIALMEYLIKMVTPKGGTVLDPFMGSGSTGIAAKLEGFNFIGIEKEEEYVKIAEARIEAWEKDPQDSLL